MILVEAEGLATSRKNSTSNPLNCPFVSVNV